MLLFVAISSIRPWPTNKYFNGNIINRGFGSSHLSDVTLYFDECSIVFIPIKSSTARWGFWGKMKKANSLIKDYAKNNEKVFYIDTASPMIGKNGKPKSDLF